MTERVHHTEAGPAPTAPATPVVHDDHDVVQQTQIITPRDLVRWGPIVAGLVTAIGTFLLLSTLALALGLQAAPAGTDPGDAGAAAGIVTAIIALLSFFVGGFVAARAAAVEGRASGLLNGFLVWALGIILILVLAASGLGALFGAAGDLFAQYRAAGSPQPDVDVNPNQLGDAIRAGAFGAFLGLALPALAAALGGLLGARDDVASSLGGRRRI